MVTSSLVNRIHMLVLLLLLFTAALAAAPAYSQPADPKIIGSSRVEPMLSREEYRKQADWRAAIAATPKPGKGCFTATFPSREWREVACVPTPDYPMPPRGGVIPQVVGNGNDVSAMAPSGFITSATGSFDSLTNVTSESGQIGAVGASIANAYTLQINTDFFTTSICPAASVDCRGWEQFVFENNNVSHRAFIQYWLIKFDAPCPAGWTTFPSGIHTYCVIKTNSTGAVPTTAVPVTNLGQVTMTGSASSSGDSIVLTIGGTAYTRNGDNAVAASQGWKIAEFNVFGDGGSAVGVGSQAAFNANADLLTRTRITYGGSGPPVCVTQSFTAETNNLSFGPTAPGASPPGPALIFRESIAGGGPSNCAASTAVGDTHLTTLNGLLYDFQATGDFVLLETASGFTVQNRQVSGAPTWPDAAVNSAVAARFGKTEVAICLPGQLYVDRKRTELERTLVLADGTQITRDGNAYLFRGAGGDWLRATVNGTYIDVKVGLGQWPIKARGLLTNAQGDPNLIAARNGTTLRNPFPFADLYKVYGDSWRVQPAESLLGVCGRTRSGIPSKPFSVRDLPPEAAKRASIICDRAGAREGALHDACMIDVAFTGKPGAAAIYNKTPIPAAVGKIR